MRSPDELDQVDWAELSHAYGSAEDVPELICGLYASEPAALDETVYELFGTVCHQGDVYAASGPAVPFLAHAARHGAGRRVDVLLLLAMMADHEPGQVGSARWERNPVSGVCAELCRVLPDLLPCLTDADPELRQAALRVVAAVADLLPPDLAADVTARIGELFENDPVPEVRADALLTLGTPGRAPSASDVPEVRLAAAVLTAELDGPPYPPELVETFAVDGARPPWDMPWANCRTLDDRLTRLLARDPDAALAVAARWIAAGDQGTRGTWLAERIAETWRDREPEALDLLLAALPHQRDGISAHLRTIAHWIERLPAPNATLRDTLFAHAATDPSALLGLVRARDPRALDLLSPHSDPQLLAEAARLMPSGRLVPLIRRRLATAPDLHLIAALPALGEPARAAVPELLDCLRKGTSYLAVAAARALGQLGTLGPELLDHLATAARSEDSSLRIAATVAHHRLTGDAAPALAAFRELLTSSPQPRWCADELSSLGPAAAPLLPLLEPLLTARDYIRFAAADAHHRLSGSPTLATPVLADLVTPTDLGLSALRSLATTGHLPDSLRPALRALAFSPHRLIPDDPLASTGGGQADHQLRTLALDLLAGQGS
ncbi:hypothetical protein ACFYS8_19035 [Kitasatospora sp. NPDC004615]|uniref:hypothetical protein n=1 Tax=Kitasatospora sp. NPDC004615 TaxID=3364017 RepID=UPI003679E0D1